MAPQNLGITTKKDLNEKEHSYSQIHKTRNSNLPEVPELINEEFDSQFFDKELIQSQDMKDSDNNN